MFGIFNKKKVNDPVFLKRITEDGISHAAERFSSILMRDSLPTGSLAHEFVMQELDGARQGDKSSVKFAKNSGVPESRYKGSLNHDTPELDKAQEFMQMITSKLYPRMDIIVPLRIEIVKNIMEAYGIGQSLERSDVNAQITDSYAPKQEVHTQQGVMKYLKDISRLSYENLCIEFSNVMAAKHNLTMVPSGINNAAENQRIVTDLVDKAFLICICKFGQERVSNFAKNDLTRVNKLIIQCDQEVAAHPVLPHEHGLRLFNKLEQYF